MFSHLDNSNFRQLLSLDWLFLCFLYPWVWGTVLRFVLSHLNIEVEDEWVTAHAGGLGGTGDNYFVQ